MPEFCDNIHHHELKEIRDQHGATSVLLFCLLAETGEYAVQLNFKEKKEFVFQEQETVW